MTGPEARLLQLPVARADLVAMAEAGFGDMVKAAVDVHRGMLVVGGDLHADAESILLEHGSHQADIWGINLYPAEAGEAWMDFVSLINIRPGQGNRSTAVEDPGLQGRIRQIVAQWVHE